MASGQLAPDCHLSPLRPEGLIARAIAPSSYAQIMKMTSRGLCRTMTTWRSYGATHRASRGLLEQCSPLVTQYLLDNNLILQREIPEIALSAYQRMRVDGVPYGTLSSTEWTLEELVKSQAVIQLRKGDHLLYAVAVAYMELRLHTLPVECLVV
jgi:hypothetical protein